MNGFRTKVVAGGAALLALVGGGAAVAATQLGTPKQESQAIVNDAAKQLGVTPTKLADALEQALANRVDAAVAAGRLTEAQGKELKARIAAGELPLLGFGGPRGGHMGHGGLPGGHLAAAASYLGVTAAELQTQLAGGKTLADVATAKGKTVAGLVAALVADEKKELDAAVKAGRLTDAQAKELLAGAEARFTEMVNGTGGPGFGRGHGGPGFPPPGADSGTPSTSSFSTGAPA
jgi:hypothetical protein